MSNIINVTYMDGPKVEIIGSDKSVDYKVCFYHGVTNELVYQTAIKAGSWSAANMKFYVPWHISVDCSNGTHFDYYLDLTDKKVLILFSSKSLGDNIAWLAQVAAFQRKHNCKIFIATFWNDLFEKAYPEFAFVGHGQELNQYDAMYVVGAYDRNFDRNKNDWRFIPLQQIASDMLGLPAEELQPKVVKSTKSRPLDKPYVCISEFSTWLSKQWMRQNGWSELIGRIKSCGYEVVSISKESTQLTNVIKANGNTIEETVRWLQYADAFVGVSCGLTVLAWALDRPVCIISGCTGARSEFAAATRIINQSVCHGCMNDQKYTLDRGNWRYCPTSRDFICSRSITPDMVWAKLFPILKGVMPNESTRSILSTSVVTGDHRAVTSDKQNRVLIVSPHCSTGGGPQYMLKCVEKLRASGHLVEFVEYNNISGTYTVQRNKIKALIPFHTLNGNKQQSLQSVMDKFKPNIVHVHEFPERFMNEDSAKAIYRDDRNWRIVETAHGANFSPDKKLYKPDAFAFVSKYYIDIFKEYGVPITVVQYEAEKRTRPDRTQALLNLSLDTAKKHVLHVGLFAPWKNQAEIFEIAKRLPEQQFHFVGNRAENFANYWKPLVDNLPANCKLWGEQEDVDRFYAAMDVLLFPSTGELNPLVIKEALSWGMPVLLRNLPTYCNEYDNEQLVQYIDDNIDNTCRLLKVVDSMTAYLQLAYDRAWGE